MSYVENYRRTLESALNAALSSAFCDTMRDHRDGELDRGDGQQMTAHGEKSAFSLGVPGMTVIHASLTQLAQV